MTEKSTKITYPKSLCQQLRILEGELERLKTKMSIGFEVKLEWSPGVVEYKNGKQLLEEVRENTIFVYVKDLDQALQLVNHGFMEWLLNQNSKPYRIIINKLIEVFEDLQYINKERIVKALTRLTC